MVSYRCIMCQKEFSNESEREAEQLYDAHIDTCMEPAKDNIKDLMEMFGLTTKKKKKREAKEHEREKV